jgi:hypothetical protein
MTKLWMTTCRLSLLHTVVLATTIAAGVFGIGHTVLQSQAATLQSQTAACEASQEGVCEDQCPFVDCAPVQAGCGGCSSGIVWEGCFRAGPNCFDCCTGSCIHKSKINPDECGVCQSDPTQQCLGCIFP